MSEGLMVPPPEWPHQKFRVATIGCGRMGARTTPAMRDHAPAHIRILSHLEATRTLGIAQSLAACDTSAEALAAARDSFKLDYTCADYGQLIAEFKPQILTIATRTPEKAAIIEAAVAGGVRALHVEKPLCNSANELRRIRSLIEETDVLMTSGCIRRYLAPFSAATEHFGGNHALRYVQVGLGRAPLMWTNFHAIDLILFYAGERTVEWVQSSLDFLDWESERVLRNDPKVLSATLYFSDGFCGQIGQIPGNTALLASDTHQLEIFADGRNAFFTRKLHADDLYLDKAPITLRTGLLSGTQGPLWILARALCGDGEARDRVMAARRDFLLAQTILFALVDSHVEGGRRVHVPTYRPELTVWGKTGDLFA